MISNRRGRTGRQRARDGFPGDARPLLDLVPPTAKGPMFLDPLGRGPDDGWEPAGREFDTVVAGTAWHWIDPVAGAAKAARVLRPGGLLASFWNVVQLPPDLAEVVADVAERVVTDLPVNFRAVVSRPAVEAYQTPLDMAADGIRAAGSFSEPQQWRHDWEFTYTRDAWLDVMPTQGVFTRLSADGLAQMLAGVGAAIDARGGSFTMTYATMAVTAQRR